MHTVLGMLPFIVLFRLSKVKFYSNTFQKALQMEGSFQPILYILEVY